MVESVMVFGYDFLKVNPRATYYAEAWGCLYRANGKTSPEAVAWVVSEPSDLDKLRVVDARKGPFGEQLEALAIIRARLEDVPLVQTVFSPLSVLGRLANDTSVIQGWLAEHPDEVHRALATIAEALSRYARATLDAGADGVFFATTEWGTYDVLTRAQYDTFGRPYDLKVLDAVSGAPFNILHVCRSRNMLSDLIDYPVHAFNWAQHAGGNTSFAEAAHLTDKALMGGVDERRTLLQGTPVDVTNQVQTAVKETGGRRFLLGPGCSIDPATPPENVRAALAALSYT
jgi:uroporphyrinogen decarboxylase